VVIETIDLKKLFTMNLDAKTYSEKPYQPMIDKATIKSKVTRESPKTDYRIPSWHSDSSGSFDPRVSKIELQLCPSRDQFEAEGKG
jgi:hypothetical protein